MIPISIKYRGERTDDNESLKFFVRWNDNHSTNESIFSFVNISNEKINHSIITILKIINNSYSDNLCWFCSNNISDIHTCVCDNHITSTYWLFDILNTNNDCDDACPTPKLLRRYYTPIDYIPPSIRRQNTPIDFSPPSIRRQNTPTDFSPPSIRRQNTPIDISPPSIRRQNTPIDYFESLTYI